MRGIYTEVTMFGTAEFKIPMHIKITTILPTKMTHNHLWIPQNRIHISKTDNKKLLIAIWFSRFVLPSPKVCLLLGPKRTHTAMTTIWNWSKAFMIWESTADRAKRYRQRKLCRRGLTSSNNIRALFSLKRNNKSPK